MVEYVENFKEWAFDWYAKYVNDDDADIKVCKDKNITFVFNLKTGKSASSRCNPAEEFSIVIGIGVAYARLCGEKIPKERRLVKISDLKNSDRFEMPTTKIVGIVIGYDNTENKVVYKNTKIGKYMLMPCDTLVFKK